MHMPSASTPETASKARSRLMNDAYETLKAAITSGELEPGERLYETAMSARFGVSRTPVREALQRLVNEGLAGVGPDGVRVTILSVKEVHSLQHVNRALQGIAARLAATQGSDEDTAKLAELMSRMENHCTLSDLKAWSEVDVEIHRHIFKMSASPWLVRLLLQIEPLLARGREIILRQAGWMERSTGEHRLIVNGIRSRDEEAAEKAMQDHLLVAERNLIEILETVVVPWRGNRI
jgi:DNA-binding GntR family transcriptional regulator